MALDTLFQVWMLNSGCRLDYLTRLVAVIDGYDGLVDAMADAPCAGVSDRMLVSPATLMRRNFPLPFVPINCAPWSGKFVAQEFIW